MDLWDLTRLLLRRWYFAVPMLVISVAVVVMAAKTVSPDYKSTGYMQLIPAPSTGKVQDPKAKQRPTNPWNDLGYAALGNAAVLTVTDQTALEKLKKEGFTDSVTVVMDERTPLFEIEAVGNSPVQASSTVQQVIKLLQADIAAKQKQYGTQAEDTISTLVINDGTTPSEESGKVKKVLIVAAGLGIIVTTAATIALDYWLRRRARRKNGEEVPDLSPKIGEAVLPLRTTLNGGGSSSALLDSAEKTRVLRPQKVASSNGNVYPAERGKPEVKAHTSARPVNGGGAPQDPPVDATVVLPTNFPPRRSQERRSQDKRP
ncbi:hypothetical protein ACQP2F_20985 [Actinoplanes sp. CA-030573]|uniref:hypothetical protein n=1 Tax=Actinoplanes sp. CA-030573 TaxID=3239898 RepID=UPI003D8A7A3E